jgi:hypothetical protein
MSQKSFSTVSAEAVVMTKEVEKWHHLKQPVTRDKQVENISYN